MLNSAAALMKPWGFSSTAAQGCVAQRGGPAELMPGGMCTAPGEQEALSASSAVPMLMKQT